MTLEEYEKELSNIGLHIHGVFFDFGSGPVCYHVVYNAFMRDVLRFKLEPTFYFNNDTETFKNLADQTKEHLMTITKKLILGGKYE